MNAIEDVYAQARQYASEEQHEARQYVNDLDIDTLRKELIDSIGLVAYYTKIERALSATPRLHYDGLRSAYTSLGADNILAQAERAVEEGVEISGTCSVTCQSDAWLVVNSFVLKPSRNRSPDSFRLKGFFNFLLTISKRNLLLIRLTWV
jgi:hypothetical protein